MLADTLKKHLHEYELLLSFLMDMQEYIHANKVPKEMILFTTEFFYHPESMCEIVLSIADDSTYLGRKENYENCIFSHFTANIGESIVINDTKNHPGFLELDPRINSEIFCEYTMSSDLSLILNMECSTKQFTDQASLWFSRVKEGVSVLFI
jgi:hypothetical protein